MFDIKKIGIIYNYVSMLHSPKENITEVVTAGSGYLPWGCGDKEKSWAGWDLKS